MCPEHRRGHLKLQLLVGEARPGGSIWTQAPQSAPLEKSVRANFHAHYGHTASLHFPFDLFGRETPLFMADRELVAIHRLRPKLSIVLRLIPGERD